MANRRYKSYSQDVYDHYFNQYKASFIKQNYEKMSDTKIGKELDVPQRMISAYRLEVLELKKKIGLGAKFILPNRISLKMQDKQDLLDELDALVKFNYNGSMIESYRNRIKQLSNQIAWH